MAGQRIRTTCVAVLTSAVVVVVNQTAARPALPLIDETEPVPVARLRSRWIGDKQLFLPYLVDVRTPVAHEIATSPMLPGVVAAVTASTDEPPHWALVFTTDGGLTWQITGVDDVFTGFHTVAVVPRQSSEMPIRLVAAGASSSVSRSGDLGATWTSWKLDHACLATEYAPTTETDLKAMRSDSTHLILQHKCVGETTAAFDAYLSVDGGVNWTHLIGLYGWESDVVPSPFDANTLFVYKASSGSGWQQTKNGGQTWEPRTFPVTGLVPDEVDARRLFGWWSSAPPAEPTWKGYASADGGDTWSQWGSQPCQSIRQLLALPSGAGHLVARCEDGLYRSLDGGHGWNRLSPTGGSHLAVDWGGGGRLFWSRYDGLLSSSDAGDTWSLLTDFAFLR